jgi:hypothetical protein
VTPVAQIYQEVVKLRPLMEPGLRPEIRSELSKNFTFRLPQPANLDSDA